MSWTTIFPSSSGRGGSNSPYNKYYDQPVVAVNNRSDILLTPAAHELLGNALSVSVMYDKSANLLGLMASDTRGPSYTVQHGYSLQDGTRKKIERGMRRISCRAAHEHGWGQPDKIVIYRASLDKNGVLVVDLRYRVEIIDAVIRHRARKAK